MSLMLPKINPIRDQKYLDDAINRPSIITGLRGPTVVNAHLGCLGRGIKRSDAETLVIEQMYHQEGHDHGEARMWRKYIPDDVLIAALRLYGVEQYRKWKSQ